ncbi:hypothetical protein B0I37DRAFT_2743 [Chaetomium sp. MPI-CAGE-AT-0009]|nr:hypothetical protein B0I37DRAFT_2743 [Chaetomium sp. MPI-CAGE-AT-0009]
MRRGASGAGKVPPNAARASKLRVSVCCQLVNSCLPTRGGRYRLARPAALPRLRRECRNWICMRHAGWRQIRVAVSVDGLRHELHQKATLQNWPSVQAPPRSLPSHPGPGPCSLVPRHRSQLRAKVWPARSTEAKLEALAGSMLGQQFGEFNLTNSCLKVGISASESTSSNDGVESLREKCPPRAEVSCGKNQERGALRRVMESLLVGG